MEELIKNVTDYLDYLINDRKLLASIHFKTEMYKRINRKVMMDITPYIIHRSPYCRFAVEKGHHRCIENQRVLISEFKDRNPVVRSCYAGAMEICYPLFKDGEVVGFISVNGYRRDEDAPLAIDSSLWKSTLDPSSIPKKDTDVLIPPLRVMVEKLLEYTEEDTEEINLILRYLADYTKTANLASIAKYLGRSKSHVSHLFKSQTGKTVRAYLNELKLYRARNLICSTDLSITEAALESGFEDTSYFVSLFKKKYGATPYKYKKGYSTERD